MANSYFNENTLEELIEEIKYVYKSDDRPVALRAKRN